MTKYIIRNESQDAWLSGRVWYAHKSYADKFSDLDEAHEVASIMEARFPNDRINVLPVLTDKQLADHAAVKEATERRCFGAISRPPNDASKLI